MIRTTALVALLTACTTADSRTLVVDGPPRLQVDELGPVAGPSFKLSDDSVPEGLAVTVQPDTVARVESGTVHAVGAGEATVDGAWNGQSASWTLVVSPRITLELVDPPAALAVGARQPLHVQATHGGRAMEPGTLTWSSSDPEVATIDEAGVVKAVSEGTTYVIVKQGEAEAMAEIAVTPAVP